MSARQFAKQWILVVVLAVTGLILNNFEQQEIANFRLFVWGFLAVYSVLLTFWAVRILRTPMAVVETPKPSAVSHMFSWIVALVLALVVLVMLLWGPEGLKAFLPDLKKPAVLEGHTQTELADQQPQETDVETLPVTALLPQEPAAKN